MTELEIENFEKENLEFTENLLNKGCFIPEIKDVITSEQDEMISGNYLILYSLKTEIDEQPFYYTPFVALDEGDMKRQLSCCSDYRMIICRLGYYDTLSGKLFTDYVEIESVHSYFMKYSEQYKNITELFGNITADELPSIYSNVCEMIIENDKENKKKLSYYIDFLKSNHIYVPEIKNSDHRILKRMFQTMKDFVAP